MKQKFYICAHCGKIIAIVNDRPIPTMCCGTPMTQIEAGSTDAAAEKHIPVVRQENGRIYVTVGSILHPMTEEHYIEWISLQTSKGNQRKFLKPNNKPEICFAICEDEQVEAVYAFCNLHSLWKA